MTQTGPAADIPVIRSALRQLLNSVDRGELSPGSTATRRRLEGAILALSAVADSRSEDNAGPALAAFGDQSGS